MNEHSRRDSDTDRHNTDNCGHLGVQAYTTVLQSIFDSKAAKDMHLESRLGQQEHFRRKMSPSLYASRA